MQLKITPAGKLAALLCLALPFISNAQNVESFESIIAVDTVKPAVFVNNGQSFTVTNANCLTGGTFGVFVPNDTYVPCSGSGSQTSNNVSTYGVGTSCSSGSCSGTSAKFLDAGASNTLSQTYGIETTNAALFTIKALYIYLSSDNSATPSNAGGVTFRGKVAGSTVFTYTKTTGFNSSFGLNNGFTFIDFAIPGYASTNIDELQIQTGAGGNYIAIDNFTWGISVPLPLTLTSFTAAEQNKTIVLNWTTTAEADISSYELEKSVDGKAFTAFATIEQSAALKYSYTDRNYRDGDNFYRLKMMGKDGNVSYSPVALVQINTVTEAHVYPNPATGKVFVDTDEAAVFQIIDLTGRISTSVKVNGKTAVSLEHMAKGLYHYRLLDNAQRLLHQGKIVVQ
jgi:hypothetical protein